MTGNIPLISIYGRYTVHDIVLHLESGWIWFVFVYSCSLTLSTRYPENIRGGGLLKYCYLLARGYVCTPRRIYYLGDPSPPLVYFSLIDQRPIYTSPQEIKKLERCMTYRFIIDYPTDDVMSQKIATYFLVRLRHQVCAAIQEYS